MPNDGGPLLIAVVCEADADRRTACLLADRVALAYAEWVEEGLLDSVRRWCGAAPSSEFLPWKAIKAEADRLHIRAHGHFVGEPGEPDAWTARRALLVLSRCQPSVAAALLIRDSDNDRWRYTGLCQARQCQRWPFSVIIGVAHPKRECWLLAGFEPRSDAENARLRSLRKELGFDPRTRSERLTAKDDKAKRSAKRVLVTFCANDEERGLASTSLDTLIERGSANGLADYLAELKSRYVPLFRSCQA